MIPKTLYCSNLSQLFIHDNVTYNMSYEFINCLARISVKLDIIMNEIVEQTCNEYHLKVAFYVLFYLNNFFFKKKKVLHFDVGLIKAKKYFFSK